MRRTSPSAWVPAAVLTGLALVGCGEGSPGSAASVDGEAISLDQVDTVARALCTVDLAAAEQRGTEAQTLSTGEYRRQVLSTLVDAELAERASAELSVDVPPAAYEQDLSQFDELFAELPDEEEEALRDYVVTFSRLQATVQAIGRETVGAGQSADPQVVIAQGQQVLADVAQDSDIELDPRFGELRRGRVVGGSGSLSVSGTDEPGPGGPAGSGGPVPASQTCA